MIHAPRPSSPGRRRVRMVGVAGAVSTCAALLVAVPAPAWAQAGIAEGPSSTTTLLIAGITVVAFLGAVVAARWAYLNPAPIRTAAPLVSHDLLDDTLAPTRESTLVASFGVALPTLLVWYLFTDHGGAWFHIPGTPLFVGEIVIIWGSVAMMASSVPILRSLRRSPSLLVLVTYMVWGTLLLLLNVTTYGLDAVRDSAIWYYGITAVFTLFLLLSDPSRLGRWWTGFGKLIPALLLWYPVALVLDSLMGRAGGPQVPDSNVPLFSHRLGNIGVVAAMIIGFLWLVERDSDRVTPNQRIAYTGLATLLIVVGGLQNRGGLVAGFLGVAAMLFLMRRRRTELTMMMVGVVVLGVTFALVTNLRVPLFDDREISAEQLVRNVTSIINPDKGRERETETTRWRLEIWKQVLDDVSTEFPLTGFGPGPDLGKRYNISTNPNAPLRNPHNSHVGVLARLGWVGAALWFVLWIVWSMQLLMLRRRFRRRGKHHEAAFAGWLLVSAGMILVNAFFDPTLEGPQVAMVLWFIFGIGAALPLMAEGIGRTAGTVAAPVPSRT